MSGARKKAIIFYVGIAVCLILLLLFTLVDVNLGIIKFSSIKSLINKHSEVSNVENDLIETELEYGTTVNRLETEQANFLKEKQKYAAITDETIGIIKNIKTEEKYSIEYMWIKLGNYARVNNLSLVMVEPGGSETTVTDKSKSSSNNTNKTTTASSDEINEIDPQVQQGALTTNTNKNPTLFKIQVTGSYIDVSSFVFEVENDKELRFKLDNIVMEYVSGTTIKATFNVKNLIINK